MRIISVACAFSIIGEAFVIPGDRTQQVARSEAMLTILRESEVGRQEDLVAELRERSNRRHD